MNNKTIKYGNFYKIQDDYQYNPKAKLIVLTSISPTSNGEGKTTTLIGLTDLFRSKKENVIGCLRQPSVGPFLGMKGGATGSGECVLQNDFEINMGLNGDFEKIALVNNLIVSVIENEIYFNSKLDIDPKKIFISRCLDLNDRSLRNINYKITKDIEVSSDFSITAASNIMAAFCLAENPTDFSQTIEQTIIAFNRKGGKVIIKDLELTNSINKILEVPFKPNLVLTKHNSKILMHGGPFANIAHGCNSIIATKVAMTNADFVFTECGFGSDLGLEKFINIKCDKANIYPNLIVYAISLKSILEHGNGSVKVGIEHLKNHLKIANSFGTNVVVILNKFSNDKPVDIESFMYECQINNIKVEISNLWLTGPKGEEATKLFNFIISNLNNNPKKIFTYDKNDDIMEKIAKITTKIYNAKEVKINAKVLEKIQNLSGDEKQFKICIAKDQKVIIGNYLKDDIFYIEDIKINYFAKLIILISTKIFLMPGLPKIPNAKGKL